MKRSQGDKRGMKKENRRLQSKKKQTTGEQQNSIKVLTTLSRRAGRNIELVKNRRKKKEGWLRRRERKQSQREEKKKNQKITTSTRSCRVQSRRQRRMPSLPSNHVHHPVCSLVNRRSKRSSLFQVLDQVFDIIQIPAQQSLLFICCPRITNHFTRTRGGM